MSTEKFRNLAMIATVPLFIQDKCKEDGKKNNQKPYTYSVDFGKSNVKKGFLIKRVIKLRF